MEEQKQRRKVEEGTGEGKKKRNIIDKKRKVSDEQKREIEMRENSFRRKNAFGRRREREV